MSGSRATFPVQINGVDGVLAIDTGAFFSVLTPSAAEKFRLRLTDLPMGFTMRGATGYAAARMAEARDFSIGGAVWHHVDFIVNGHDLDPDLDGMLGENFLAAADTEYDLLHGAIRFWKPQGCDRFALAYWDKSDSYSAIAIERLSTGNGAEQHILSTAMINGMKVKVLFDTGFPRSALTLSAARRIGITPASSGVVAAGSAGGFGARRVDAWIATLDKFEIGDEQILHPRLMMADFDLMGAELVLGADFFLSHRVYVAESQSKLYFTYEGGKVFNLEENNEAAAAPTPVDGATPAPPSPAETDQEQPTNADGFARRGSAYASRHEYGQAVADFTSAIALEPTNASHFYDRAMAHLGASETALATADLDQAVKLKPDDAHTLMARGFLRMAAKDSVGADADFGAAMRLDGSLWGEVVDTEIHGGLYEAAIGHVDQWIGAHPKDEAMATALNNRCWARALWGKELDQALTDCDSALRLVAGASNFLDSRGLVHLRRGEFDLAVADYSAALHKNPKIPTSLYGRGLAEQHLGQKALGDADIAAAVAINPKIADDMAKVGVGP